MRRIFEDRFLFEEGVYWTYTTDEKRNIDRKDEQRLPSYFLRITKLSKNREHGLYDIFTGDRDPDFRISSLRILKYDRVDQFRCLLRRL